MANITGTEQADVLRGENMNPLRTTYDGIGFDVINGLGGDDKIIATTGNDTIDGGAGNDIVDYGEVAKNLFLSVSGEAIDNVVTRRFPPAIQEVTVAQSLRNVEKIIGNPNQINTISAYRRYPVPFPDAQIDIDLAKGTVSNNNGLGRKFSVENFDNVDVPSFYGSVVGNDRNNVITGSVISAFLSDGTRPVMTIVGSKGDDTLIGNTIDYSNLGRAVRFTPGETLAVSVGDTFTPPRVLSGGAVDKGIFGKDKVAGFQKIIGATNKRNSIDASTAPVGASFDINLANNLVKVSAQGFVQQIKVSNFVDVIGSQSNDVIQGGNANSKLTGGAGSDAITGGAKNDQITGTNGSARGVGEVDTLTGGAGADKFIVGDSVGSYYVGNQSTDYAQITDFNIFTDSIAVGNLKDYSFGLEGNGTINLFAGKTAMTGDLIAKIQLADLSPATAARSSAVSASSINSVSSNLEVLTSQINILSGVNPTV
jgi:Ca2+-binding RTX toxin-like protein